MPTDCLVDVIFIKLAAHYFELKNIYMATIFIWILTNDFNSQNMIKISYTVAK